MPKGEYPCMVFEQKWKLSYVILIIVVFAQWLMVFTELFSSTFYLESLGG